VWTSFSELAHQLLMLGPFSLQWLPVQEGMAAEIHHQPQERVLLRQLVLAGIRQLLVLPWVLLHPLGQSKLPLPLSNLPARMFVVTICAKQCF
jgi:hypothetical protein